MQIQLRQTEIVAALKAHIVAQGISLTGKSFGVSFTAGRKDAGLSADISIEDLVASAATEVVTAVPAPDAKPTLPVVASPAPEAEVKAEVAPEAKAPTTSLFGG